MNELECETLADWHDWLERNHRTDRGVWLVFYKRGSGRPWLDYDGALDEALCFGWIDSLIRKIDESRCARKFTPRKPASKWSEINKRRVARLAAEGRMTAAGLAVVAAARANGWWDRPDRPPVVEETPGELVAALEQNETARRYFEQLAPAHRRQFVMWIATAKRPETRERRLRESLELLEQGRKLGLR